MSGPTVRAILEGRKTRRKLYVRRGENPAAYAHLARRLANGLDAAPEHGCWVWMLSARKSGHATMRVNGHTVSAYRIAYQVGVGPIPPGAMVLHRCDNPRCIRPDHLELGGQAKNMADCSARRRTARGAHNGQARLSATAVGEIRGLRSSGTSQSAVAARFGVTGSTVGRIWRGESWE